MATGFSVSVNIGGKLLPSLASAVAGAKSQINGLAAITTGIAARINAPFIAAQKTIAATTRHLERAQRVGRNMSFGVTTPAAMIGANWLKSSVDFEKALNLSEALGDLPSAERSGLEKIAQDLAKRYDAGGAVGIIQTTTELMKAGLSFEQAKGSIEQVLAASALAGDMTPADVGASLSKSLAQFQMPVANLNQVTKSAQLITDRMTYAAVSTVASMKDISESFKYAGGVMSATGNSLDQTTAIVMSFAKAGVLGSEAGVALRSALVRLVKMPKGGMKALSRIGMNLADYTQARPVTADTVLSNLRGDGIDASKARGQIEKIIRGREGRSPDAVTADITKAVQGAVGSSSAVDADKISESVNDAYAAAGLKVDITRFMKDLKGKMDAGIATTGDIAQILEARHISRYMALLKDDLPGLIAKVGAEAEGYAQSRYGIVQKGLPADATRLSAAYDQFRKSLVKVVTPEISSTFERLANTIDRIGKASPATLKLGIGLAAAAAAAGPLFVLGAVGRVGTLALTGLLAPIGLVARGIVSLGAAMAGVAVAGITRLGVLATGLRMLSTFGTGAVLAAMGGSLLALGRAVLLFPVTALRAIGATMWLLVANPVGLIIGGLVVALTALGIWVANNWNGVKTFFSAFGSSFMEGIGGANGPLGRLVGYLQSAYQYISQLLGPLDQTAAGWRSWGEAVGGAAASGVNAVVSAIQKLIGFLSNAYDWAKKLGNAVTFGYFGGGASPAPVATPAPAIAGKRALGGPVLRARPYLVGERGPELFVPGAFGRIETNDMLRSFTADGAAAVAGSTSTSSTRTYTLNPTINIMGGDDPREIAGQVRSEMERYLRDLEAEQRGLLSD